MRERERVSILIISDEITTICVNDKEAQQNVAPKENETNHTSSTKIINNNETLSK